MVAKAKLAEDMDGTGPFDADRVRPLVVDAVGRKMELLAAFKDLERDDLVQIGIEAVRKDHHKYDPKRSKYSTFVNRIVSCQMIDLWRVRSREHKRMVLTSAKPGYVAPVEVPDDSESMAAWAGNIMTLARASMGRYLGGFEPAQMAAIIALQRREQWDPEQTVVELGNRPDVRRALGIQSPPPLPLLRAMSKTGLPLWFGKQ